MVASVEVQHLASKGCCGATYSRLDLIPRFGTDSIEDRNTKEQRRQHQLLALLWPFASDPAGPDKFAQICYEMIRHVRSPIPEVRFESPIARKHFDEWPGNHFGVLFLVLFFGRGGRIRLMFVSMNAN
jgi:hypothetical protein